VIYVLTVLNGGSFDAAILEKIFCQAEPPEIRTVRLKLSKSVKHMWSRVLHASVTPWGYYFAIATAINVVQGI
jgi:hypothetical protein